MTEDLVTAPERRYVWVLQCPRLTGDSEYDMVDVASDHLAELHPDLAENYGREHILFMATRFVR